ncbi:hypothetical protein CDAR_582071 [Caerostris darwini]|uniref:Uncharacterized protein n=1 Tax=Caerostris darwini TaxID=1538125 RepID=A0AAV4X8Z5_9ARAC|nr:hypothetical protein CDAR_582071 [Caerostris darwini]
MLKEAFVPDTRQCVSQFSFIKLFSGLPGNLSAICKEEETERRGWSVLPQVPLSGACHWTRPVVRVCLSNEGDRLRFPLRKNNSSLISKGKCQEQRSNPFPHLMKLPQLHLNSTIPPIILPHCNVRKRNYARSENHGLNH